MPGGDRRGTVCYLSFAVFIYSFLVLDFLKASICMFHMCWFCNWFWTHVVHRWLFLGEPAPVALAVWLFCLLSKMYRDPFLLKIFTLGCVSSLFQDLARSAVSPEAPAGFFSRLWSQREFNVGFSCSSPNNALHFVGSCLGYWPLFWLLFNKWLFICSLVELA